MAATELNLAQLQTGVSNVESKKKPNKDEVCGDCHHQVLDHRGFHLKNVFLITNNGQSAAFVELFLLVGANTE